MIEWIPLDKLENIQKIDDKFSAIWLDGIRSILGERYKYKLSRSKSCGITLKVLSGPHYPLAALKEFKDYMQLANIEIYGLTQNTNTGEYMMVYDVYYSERKKKCTHCNKHNTSPAWCQACDPQKITQGWASGNNGVDDCIKEFQLRTTKY